MTYYHNNTSLNHNNHSSKTLFLIGAGLHNAVLAREMANIGFNVKIYEQRSHIGGNCFDTTDKKQEFCITPTAHTYSIFPILNYYNGYPISMK